MNIIVPQTDLSRAVHTAARAISTRSTHPGGNAMSLSVADNRLTFDASDGEIRIRTGLPVSAADSFQISVPGRYLADVIAKLGPGDVEIELAPDRPSIGIKWRATDLMINGWQQDQLDPTPDTNLRESIAVSPGELRTAISRVLTAVSEDETRPVLTGALFSLREDTLTLVATDGFRMCHQRIPLPVPAATDVTAIIPARALSHLTQLLGHADEIVQFSVAENNVSFSFGETIFSASVISGQFPNYEQVIPPAFSHTFQCARTDITAACERASIVASETNRAISLRFCADTLEISTSTDEKGHITDRMPCSGPADEFQITFDARLLLDALRSSSTDNLHIDAISPTHLIRVRNHDDNDFFYIVLPLRRAH